MSSFYDFLARNTPVLQTRKALILTGLQNEFLADDGRLSVLDRQDFIQRIKDLINAFRAHGDIIWVRSEYDPMVNPHLEEIDDYNTVTHIGGTKDPRQPDTIDEELYLNPSTREPRLCLKDTNSANILPELAALVQPQDVQLVKNQYSAFSSTCLLMTLRSRLVTKLYIAGALSNLSSHATALDAARNGIETVLIEDCLAWRHLARHQLALKRLSRYSVARTLTSGRALHLLQHPEDDIEEAANEVEESSEEDARAGPHALEIDEEDNEEDMPLPTTIPFRMAYRPRDKPTRAQVASSTKSTCQMSSRTAHGITTMATVPNEVSPSPAGVTERTPLFGQQTEADSNGSSIIYNLLPPELASTAFEQVQAEIEWQRMLHQTGEVPRLVCCQATVNDDGSVPVYRHPSDRTIMARSWTATIDQIRRAAEAYVGHELNHGLIQLYRSGNDFISEHSDKTLDIVPSSTIVNVSIGAERTMRLRSKRTASSSAARTTHRVRMPHNSLLSMTLETNAKYLHGINADKRPRVELNEAEMAFAGQRISMTFRQIGTFCDVDGRLIWGQGAVAKTKETAGAALDGVVEESDKLIKAFGTENQSSCMDWNAWYGAGSDVLHLK
ncbi:hypothetical protein AMS68_000029 [Peltaster fructicola]|uniref:Fe2OG dioxygenase domain-containing protein n=1 Tax=Peltaster fructicola TaxID=286661 RepID=A0A6H0XIH0_9PEZI|nr:hypothetical protein AMS68_000029 [Peltaster fructicola]